jgi:hypothetical protein
VAGELAGFPSAGARELQQLIERLDRLQVDRVPAEEAARVARTELDALGLLKRRGEQGDELRAALQRAQTQHAYLTDQAHFAPEQIATLRSNGDPVAWVEHHADQVRDLRAIDNELAVHDRRAQRQLVRPAQKDPPRTSPAVLGERPPNYTARIQWERGVRAIETYRHRQGIPPNYGGHRPRHPVVPKSLRPSAGGASPFASPRAPGSMVQASQCVNVPTGASGSSTTSARARVPASRSVHDSGGETSWPSHAWRCGMASPCANASLLRGEIGHGASLVHVGHAVLSSRIDSAGLVSVRFRERVRRGEWLVRVD